jgi:hypothetical protein
LLQSRCCGLFLAQAIELNFQKQKNWGRKIE